MPVIMKINKGTTEKLLEWKTIRADQSKNITDKDLAIEIENFDLVIEPHKEDGKRMLELSDLNGSFGVWIELTRENVSKLKGVLDF
jgi:hypothetical protein